MLSKKCVISGIWFKKLFNILAPLNTVLQSRDMDLLTAVNVIFDAQNILKDVRNNKIDK